MKKIFVIVAGLLVSNAVLADDFPGSTNVIEDTDCEMLAENVTINLSKDVLGGFDCNSRSIVIAACHPTGRKSTRTLPVETCTDADPPVCTTENEPVTGSAVPYASTERGTVTSEYPGGDCTTAAFATAIATDKLTPTTP